MSGSRITLALFWLVAGTIHFVRPQFYDGIVPPPLDEHARAVTYVSGVAELVGAALALSGPRRVARWYLLLLLAAVYPANIHMALHPEEFPKIPSAALWARLPLQGVCAWFTWRGTR